MTPNQTLVAFGNVLKKITLSLFLVVACNAFAQVGVGTQTPVTSLDVVGAAGTTPGALNTIDGIAVPVVTDDMTTTTTAGSRISQLVYSNNAPVLDTISGMDVDRYEWWMDSDFTGGTVELNVED